MRASPARRAVFTQGFPFLSEFAKRHFLPEHPLSNSPLWLDEGDFERHRYLMRARGLPSRLNIDRYAHHPELSPYSRRGRSARRRRSRTRDPSTNNSLSVQSPLPSPAANLPPSTDASSGDGARSPALKMPAAARRSRSAAERTTDEERAAADSSYVTPICTIVVHRHMYMHNLEQMQLDPQSPYARDSGALVGPSAATTWNASPVGDGDALAARLAQTAQTLSPPGRAEKLAGELHHTESLADEEYVKELRARFPSPTAAAAVGAGDPMTTKLAAQLFSARDTTSRGLALSISNGKPWHYSLQPQLLRAAKLSGYDSPWWGTVAQWRRVGATPRPRSLARAHLMYMPRTVKVVHASLLANAEEVLACSYISGKTGVFMYMVDVARDGAQFNVGFQEAVMNDMRVHRYACPLYFSGSQLQDLQLALRPDAVGITKQQLTGGTPDQVHYPSVERFLANGAVLEEAAPPPPRAAATAAAAAVPVKYFYHISQLYFPDGFTVPLRAVTAELEHNAGVALHGVTGRVLPFVELSRESVRDAYPEIGAVLYSDTAGADLLGAAPADARAPEVSAASCAGEDGGDGAIAAAQDRRRRLMELPDEDFAALVRARVNPRATAGRSLWFLAEDVLSLDGVVDVNAAPVEVREVSGPHGSAVGAAGAAAFTGDGATPLADRLSLYNVECLLSPDEGYRIVNQRVRDPMEQR